MLLDIGGKIIDADKQLLELDRADYEDSLYLFLRAAWRYIDPSPWADGWPIEAVAEHLQAVVDGDIRQLIINIPPRMGKQVADDTPILTIDGWKTHGALVVGDYVFHPTGRPTRVVAISEPSPSNVRVEFFDGSAIHCHENHEWTLFNRMSRQWETIETNRFLKSRQGRWGLTAGRKKAVVSLGRALHQLPPVDALDYPQKELALHPYVLGAWLGDGSAGKPCITHAKADYHIIDKIVACGYPVSTVSEHKTTGVLTTYFAGPGKKIAAKLTQQLRDLGVCLEKAIPERYQRASIEQRLELLAGLIDTDGHVDAMSRCSFTSVNRTLIAGVAELVRSFGWRVTICETQPRLSSSGIQGTRPYWTLAFQPSTPIPTALPRKAIKHVVRPRRIGLKSVEIDACGKIGRCIQVAAPDGLYLVGRNLVPTHNSSMCAVALPAFTWAQRYDGPTCGPQVQFLHASYAEQLSMRDSVKCRRLIKSAWYQKLWGSRFSLLNDQDTKHRFGNDKGGERLITSISGHATGEGGQVIVIDDPNAANEAFSEATIKTTIEWWDQTMSSRLNDAKTGAFIIIQQRLAEDDLTGHVLSTDADGFTHLCLPMHYEPERSFSTSIGWKDPRTTPGELLWPERFGEEEVKTLERRMGPFISAGQLEQRPEPKGGGVIKREWWLNWEEAAFPPMDYILASLDTAYTEKTENDYSAMTIWGVFSSDTMAHAGRTLDHQGRPMYLERSYDEPAPKVMLMHAWQDRLPLHELVTKCGAVCTKLKIDKLLIENKAAGISVAQEIRRLYGHETFGVQLHDPRSQDKLSRLYSVQHLFAEGMVYAPERAWADLVITQVGIFPHGKHDDLVDTVSQALRHLRDIGLLVRGPERLAEIEDMKQYVKQPEPLYPA